MKRFLVFLSVMLTWMVQAQPEPAIWRSVLTTNRSVPFGNTGQALFRTANLPYLNWSNILAQVIDTNAFQPASSVLTNLANNPYTGYTNQTALTNSGQFIASHLGNGTNTTFWQSNAVIPPVVIVPVIGSTTNRLEVRDTNGSPKMVVDSNGRVGINTNLPTAVLEVRGTNGPSQFIFRVNNAEMGGSSNALAVATNGNISINRNGVGGALLDLNGDAAIATQLSIGGAAFAIVAGTPTTWRLGVKSRAGDLWYFGDSAFTNGMLFQTNGNPPRFAFVNAAFGSNATLAPNIRFGHGTNEPQSALHVTSDNSAANALIVDTTNRHSLMVVTTNAQVGVNTNNPQAKLHVVGPTAADGQASPYIVQVENPMVGNATNAFVLVTNGNVGIGMDPATRKLNVNGTVQATTYYLNAGNDSFAVTDWAANTIGRHRIRAYNASGYLSFGTGGVDDRFVILTNGTSGFGTNLPQSELQVTGDNNQPNVFIAGTTNRPSLLTLTTNGVLSVNPGGGLNPVGCYGALMMNATNIVVCAGAAGVYTNVAGTGYTTIVTNGFYGSVADALTNLYAGWYRVTVCASALGQNNQATEWELFTNSVACDLIGMKKTYDAAARMDDLSMSGIVYLPASTRVDFRVQDAGTGGSISIHRASITVGTP